MDSIKTKAKNFVVTKDHKCIAQIMAVAERVMNTKIVRFRIYVAWEWDSMAEKGVFGFAKSRELYETVTAEAIDETANYGKDIGGSGEEKKIFKNMF